MPSARLRLAEENGATSVAGLPELLHTPHGTVLIEIQGVINVGERPLIRTELDIDQDGSHSEHSDEALQLGSLDLTQVGEAGRPVKLLVGKNQLLSGTVQKLAQPLAVLQMPAAASGAAPAEIPVVEVVTHKLVFNKRPQPVLSASAA